MAPISAPTLVPATQSMGTPAFFERADHADVRDAAGEASGQGQADAWAIAGGARFSLASA